MIKEVAAVCRKSKGKQILRWVLKNTNVKFCIPGQQVSWCNDSILALSPKSTLFESHWGHDFLEY